VGELTRAAIREWLAQLTDRRELSTVRTRHKGLQRFCGWLVAEGEIDANAMAGLEAPSANAKPVPVLTDTELAALLKACSGETFPDRRDEALIRVLLDCGVRVSQTCGLTVEAVDLDDGMALVKGKGSKVRPVYMGTRTVRSTAISAPAPRSAGLTWTRYSSPSAARSPRMVPAAASACAERPPASTSFTRVNFGTPSPTIT